MNQGKFWMVFNPQGRSPTYMHPTRAEADAEAQRLAQENTGQQFIVLKSVGGFQVERPPLPPIKKIDMKKFFFDNVPF